MHEMRASTSVYSRNSLRLAIRFRSLSSKAPASTSSGNSHKNYSLRRPNGCNFSVGVFTYIVDGRLCRARVGKKRQKV